MHIILIAVIQSQSGKLETTHSSSSNPKPQFLPQSQHSLRVFFAKFVSSKVANNREI